MDGYLSLLALTQSVNTCLHLEWTPGRSGVKPPSDSFPFGLCALDSSEISNCETPITHVQAGPRDVRHEIQSACVLYYSMGFSRRMFEHMPNK